MSVDKHKERLFVLFQEKRISQTELQVLLDSIDTKNSFFYKTYLFLINPFQKIAGFQALCLGIIILILMAYFGTKADIHYPNSINFGSTIALNRKLNFIETLCEQLILCSLLALFFYLFSFVYQKGKVRFIDFLGTIYFARFPFLITTLYFLILRHLCPSILLVTSVSAWQYVMELFLYVGFTWQITTYFFAFKESSGLKDTRLWSGFIACIILEIFISGVIIQNMYGLHRVKL